MDILAARFETSAPEDVLKVFLLILGQLSNIFRKFVIIIVGPLLLSLEFFYLEIFLYNRRTILKSWR